MLQYETDKSDGHRRLVLDEDQRSAVFYQFHVGSREKPETAAAFIKEVCENFDSDFCSQTLRAT